MLLLLAPCHFYPEKKRPPNKKMIMRGTSLVVQQVALLLWLLVQRCNCQFISHISAKGLRGNITFDAKDVDGTNLLIISGTLEASLINGGQDEEILRKINQSILFDWDLHSNTLNPEMLASCTNDDLGAKLVDKSNTTNDERPLVLGKTSNWTVGLQEFLEANSVPNLGALLWGKSIRIKLSSTYFDATKQPSPSPSQHQPSALAPARLQPPKQPSPGQAEGLPATPSKPPGRSSQPFGGLNRPQLVAVNQSTSPAPHPSGKPTFAPRPKPSLGGRVKPAQVTVISSQPPPKAESLVLADDAAATAVAPPRPRRNMTKPASDADANNNKQIMRLFGGSTVCGNIIDLRQIKSLEANFESTTIGGRVTLRGNEDDTTLLMLNLYHIKSKVSTRHDWRLLASDILDNRRHGDECKYLETVFDPNNVDDSKCKRGSFGACKMGDLAGKHGQIQVAGVGKSSRTTLVDLNLPLSALEGSRSLFIVIYEVTPLAATATPQKAPPSQILSCAQLRPLSGRKVEALINMDGVRGSVKLSQRHPTEPTTIAYDLFGLEGNVRHQSIRELPVGPRVSGDNGGLCSQLGDVYNPHKVVHNAGDRWTSLDSFPVGNLSAKHGHLQVIDSDYEDHYMGEFMDLGVQLYGPKSVVGRSLVLHKNSGDPWTCASLRLAGAEEDAAISLAVASFLYPVVGTISFQQPRGEPHADTGVLVELYNPNGERNSEGHQWLIHLKPAMADFYNWSQRCESAGEVYDPLQAAASTSDLYSRQCQAGLAGGEPLRCKLGDTSHKSGFKLSLPTSHHNRSRFYYTDPQLPLSGRNSIIGRSVVIYDDQAPVQRGNRLACSTIRPLHPLRAAVRQWSSGPSIPSAIVGEAKFEQVAPGHPTQFWLDLSGFNGNVEHYAIHQVWTQDDREFPCSNDSLYDIYDPYDTENSQRLPPSAHYGALATTDRVKVGDMSRKHGSLEGLQAVKRAHLDANLPLFAPRSIIGRSIVLRAAVNDFRWVCGNIELDYDRKVSREIIGVASFDEPRSKIAGQVKFMQLEHQDGSLSDTFIQVDLKLQSDGIHELETSHDHNWAIFVNQVGEDAYIAAEDVRCIAAGFKWNPYLVQDNLESYPSSCNSAEQLACAMGDLGQRHGALVLGPNNRRALSDSNLPLTGNYSIMGRSLVIFDNKRSNHKLACANIFPDVHLKSNVVIKRTPSFTVARFIEQMRTLLGAAEWLIVPELRATKSVANGECVQMTIHFYGQRAHQLQSELNNLISLGTVRKSTRSGVDKISTHYKLCRIGETPLTSSTITAKQNHAPHLIMVLFVVALFITS